MWLLLLLVIPPEVLGTTASAAPTGATAGNPATDADLKYEYNDAAPQYSDLSDVPEAILSTPCNDLNKDLSTVYVSSMEPESTDGSTSSVDIIDGPNKNATLVKNHSLETSFHSQCPVDLASCSSGFTVAMWFSYVANKEKWAEDWPPAESCTLANINGNIRISSNTSKKTGTEDVTNELHIDLKTNSQKYQRLTLSSHTTDLMKPHVRVCKNQTLGFNCSKGSDADIKRVGWQWNHFALSAQNVQGTYTLRAFFNGNSLDRSNVTFNDASLESLFEKVDGILLNCEGSPCDHIGFDDFVMWNRSLSEDDILKLRVAEFCDEITTTPPEKHVHEVIDPTELNITVTAEDKENITFVTAIADKLESAFEALQEDGNVKTEELVDFVNNQLETLEELADNAELFANEDTSKKEKEEAAKRVLSALSAAATLTHTSDADVEEKEKLTTSVVENVEKLSESMLKSGANMTVETPTMSVKTVAVAAEEDETIVSASDGTSVVIPKGATDATAGGETRAVVVAMKYELFKNAITTDVETTTSDTTNLEETENELTPILAGDIIGISLPEGVELKEPIILVTSIQSPHDEDRPVPNCVYLNADGKWSVDGAAVIKYDKAKREVTCQLDHLTNFAVLMAVTELKISEKHSQTLGTLTIVCTSISLVALFIALLILFIFRELCGTRISILKHLSIAMFIAQLVFITAVEKANSNRKLCLVIAVFIHYLFLSVFFWMLAQGIFLYMKLRVAVRSDANIVWFCLIGWGFPAIMVTVTAGINIKAYGRDDLCWLNIGNGGAWAFVGPVLGIILINCVVIVMAMKAFTSVKSFKDKDDKEKFRSTLKAMIVMLPILGLTWIFGVFAHIPGTGGLAFMYIFAICNGLQGFFLFVFHIVFNAEVRRVVTRALLKRSGSVGAGEEPSFFRKMLELPAEQSTMTSTTNMKPSTPTIQTFLD